MKKSIRLLVKLSFLVFIIVNVWTLSAQDRAYWQDLAVENPAAIGTKANWLYGGYAYADFDYVLQGYFAGVDYELSPEAGTMGLVVQHLTADEFERSLFQFNYAYTLSFNNGGNLSFGISGGVLLDSYPQYVWYGPEEEVYNPYDYSPYEAYNSGGERMWRREIKGGLGVFYNSEKFDAGFGYSRYFEWEDEVHYEPSEPEDMLSAQAAYRFQLSKALTIEPNVSFDFVKDEVDRSLGMFVSFHRFWAGYNNYNSSEIHSFLLGVDIKGRVRIGYSYDFSDELSYERVEIHNVLLGFRL